MKTAQALTKPSEGSAYGAGGFRAPPAKGGPSPVARPHARSRPPLSFYLGTRAAGPPRQAAWSTEVRLTDSDHRADRNEVGEPRGVEAGGGADWKNPLRESFRWERALTQVSPLHLLGGGSSSV